MKPSIISDIKKKRGRPPKPGGSDPGVFVRLPAAVLEAVDELAQARDMSRSEVIRRLVERGLNAKRAR